MWQGVSRTKQIWNIFLEKGAKASPFSHLFIFTIITSWVRTFFIRQTRQIIHACIQRHSNPFTLLKRIIALAILNLRIIALVNTCQMLHFYLRISQFFSQIFQSWQSAHLFLLLWRIDLLRLWSYWPIIDTWPILVYSKRNVHGKIVLFAPKPYRMVFLLTVFCMTLTVINALTLLMRKKKKSWTKQ